jgi:ribonuclease VapC
MVVDSSAVIAILLREPEAQVFADCIGRHRGSVISAANYVEVAMVALGRGRIGRELVDATLSDVGLEIVPVSTALARDAADAFAAYGRGRHPAQLNFGDCFAYALAKSRDEPLLFKGDDFAQTDLQPAL